MSTEPTPVAKTNVMALVGFILTMASFVFGITVIPGIVLGHIGLSQIKKTGEQGRGLAIAAIAVGYSIVGLMVLVCGLMILGFVIAASHGGNWVYSNS